MTNILSNKKSLSKLIEFISDIRVLKIKSIITNVSYNDSRVQNIVNKRVNEINTNMLEFLKTIKDVDTIS